MKQEDVVLPQRKLGMDLPDTEEALFEIKIYPLFDNEYAIDILGSKEVVSDIFKSFYEDIKEDLVLIKEADKNENWDEVRRISHKLKGSAGFGTIRLFYALAYLEGYLKA